MSESTIEKLTASNPVLLGLFVAGSPGILKATVCSDLELCNGSLVTQRFLVWYDPSAHRRNTQVMEEAPRNEIPTVPEPDAMIVSVTKQAVPGSSFPCLFQDEKNWYFAVDSRTREEVKITGRPIPYMQLDVLSALSATTHAMQGQTKDLLVSDLNAGHRLSLSHAFVAISRVRRECDIRFLPMKDDDFSHLFRLQNDPEVVKAVFGVDLDTNESAQKHTKQPTAPKKKARNEPTNQHTSPHRRQQSPGPKPKKVSRTVPQQHVSPLGEDFIDSFVAATGISEEDIERSAVEIPMIESNGSYISETVIEVTVECLRRKWSGPCDFLQRNYWELAADNPEAYPLDPFVNYSTWLHYGGHFVAVRVDPNLKEVAFAESLRHLTDNADVATSGFHVRQKELEKIATVFSRVWGCDVSGIVFVDLLVQQQQNNDCAIHTINNILSWLAPTEKLEFSRRSLGLAMRKLCGM